MKNFVNINGVNVGENCPTYLVGEIGINHNGDVNIAKKLIDLAVKFKFSAVKFQKRTIDIVYTKDELKKYRESPFGNTNGDLKRALEFGMDEYTEINNYCKQHDLDWFCSPWDEKSVDFLESFEPICYKIASASITDQGLLEHIKSMKRPIIMSTGMSSIEEIDKAVSTLKGTELLLLHTTSTYPSRDQDLNLKMIRTLAERYDVPVGYSGHEVGVMPSVFAATVFNACIVERHITLDRAMWGSDQAASLEPKGMELLSNYISQFNIVKGSGVKTVLKEEIEIKNKLRRIG